MRDRKLNTTNRTQSHSSQRTGKTPTRISAAPNPQYDPLAKIMRQTGNSASAEAAMLNRAPSLASRSLLQLQRQHGNRYVQRVLAISRQGEEGEEVSPEVEASIQRQRGAGQALEHPVQNQMESAFGTDFSSVRVHADAEANKLNEALNARAFTTGQDIFFRQGEYSPNSSQGKELLAHELTHVVQQAGGIQGKLRVSQPGDRSEQEADRMAQSVMHMSQTNSEQSTHIHYLCPACEQKLYRQPDRQSSSVIHIATPAIQLQESERGFYDYFKECMKSMGLPAPSSIFGSLTTAVATIKSLEAAVSTFGTNVTIGELIGAGTLGEGLTAAAGLTASFYLGACIGCLSNATGQSLSGGYSLGDALYDWLGPEPGLWLADTFGL